MAQTTRQEKLDYFFGVSLRIMGVVFITRFMIDVGTRMIFPFIPQISAGLGVSVAVFGWIIFYRTLSGFAGPIFGLLADRYGRRTMMLSGLFFQGVGSLAIVVTSGWWAVAPMVVIGLALTAFIPAQQAYISDQAPTTKQGRALGAIEFSWAIAGIIALPIVGIVIEEFGWQMPFLALGVLSFVFMAFVWIGLPPTEHRPHAALTGQMSMPFSELPWDRVLLVIAVAFCNFWGVNTFLSVWGVWLEADFGAPARIAGFVASAIGVTELLGSVSVSLFIDRLGKRLGTGLALIGLAISLSLLPFLGTSLVVGIIMLVVIGYFLEFTIVGLVPLYAEQVPEARGTIMSLALVGITLGGALATPISLRLLADYGVGAAFWTAAGVVLIGAGLTRFLREGEPEEATSA